MPSEVGHFTDKIEAVVRTADGRIKHTLTKRDFPLTCREGDVITIAKVGDHWEMYRLTRHGE